ncbi:MAG: XRE family transcriptional regulator, partial [Myxococcales bacterium]
MDVTGLHPASPADPAWVRQLRGPLSRAAFARQLGVTPQTIYRWELPADAREARRPRGLERARLEQIAAGPGAGAPG